MGLPAAHVLQNVRWNMTLFAAQMAKRTSMFVF
jgi:hypothetical protein